MASITTIVRRIRKHKHRSAGAARKLAIRRAQRIQSEHKLELALGEKIPLKTLPA